MTARPFPILIVVLALLPAAPAAGEASHGFAYFGDLKYPKDMPHFDYANPDAPKGGALKLSIIGTFNNVHAYVDRGNLSPFMDTRLARGSTTSSCGGLKTNWLPTTACSRKAWRWPTTTVGSSTRCATTRTGMTANR